MKPIMKTPLRSLPWLVAPGLAAALFAAGGCASTPPEKLLPPLNTVSGSPHLPGKFVWADLVTDDVPAAQKFYSHLFGWTFRNLDGYVVAANDDRPLAGMFHRPRPQARSAQPRWFGYISVSDVSRTCETVAAAGGKVLMPAKRLPDRGELAVLADAEGALVGVVKSSSGDPQDFLADPGDWIWIQLLSRDARKAALFYQRVAGYEIIENTETNRVSDFILASEGFARATVRTIPPANTQTKPVWLAFVRVNSVKDTAAQAAQLGGKVLIAPVPELLEGRVAVIADPTGAAIGIMEWQENLVKGDR